MHAFMVRVIDHRDGLCGLVTDVETGATATFRGDRDLIAVLDGHRPLQSDDRSSQPARDERGAL